MHVPSLTIKAQGYPLTHSTSVSQNANNSSNWSSAYSRSSSISTESCYPSPTSPSMMTGQDDQDEEEEPWSESLETPYAGQVPLPESNARLGKVTITDVTSVASVDLSTTEENSGDKTPKPANTKTFTMEELVQAAHRIQSTETQSAQRYPIQEKAPPTVAMANPVRQQTRKQAAPRPPSYEDVYYQDHNEGQSYYNAPRPASPQPYMTQERPQQPQLIRRPASRAGTSASANESGPRINRLSRPAVLPQQVDHEAASRSSPLTSECSAPSGRCPHCKINRFLPHSPGCPKRK